MTEIDIPNRFPPASEAEWRRLVERVLDGRRFESLVSTTFEGLKIAPLYQRPTTEGAHARRQHHGPWRKFGTIEEKPRNIGPASPAALRHLEMPAAVS